MSFTPPSWAALASHRSSLELRPRDGADRLPEPAIVESRCRVANPVASKEPQDLALVKDLGLERADHRFGKGVIIQVANAAPP